jgi:hypothetical protein
MQLARTGKVERPNGTFGTMVQFLIYSAGLSARFWSAALVHAVYLKNHLYHKALYMTPHEAWTGENPALAHLCNFGALLTARKPGKRPAKADHRTDHGVLLDFGATTKHIRYFDRTTNREKMSTHHTIYKAHYGKTRCSPGPQILMDMGYEQETVPPAITTPPPVSRYPLRSRHKSITTFVCKLLPLPINEFVSAPFTIIASVTTSDIDRNDGVTVTFSTDLFGLSFPEMIFVYGIHPTLGLNLHYEIDRHQCQLTMMYPGTPSHSLSQWKSRIRSVRIISIETMYVDTIADVRLIISEAGSANNQSIVVAFTKDDAPNCLSVFGLPQLYFDQLRSVKGHIDSTILTVVRKAITDPQFNRRTLQN